MILISLPFTDRFRRALTVRLEFVAHFHALLEFITFFGDLGVRMRALEVGVSPRSAGK